MKCPSCGYNSFDHLEYCKKCGSPLVKGAEFETPAAKDNRKTRNRGVKDHAEPESGELFLDIPIREPESRPIARRKRIQEARTGGEPESYELFPESKEIEYDGKPTGIKRNEPRAAREAIDETEFTEPLQEDPFTEIENDGEEFDRGPGSKTDQYVQEADVYNLAGFIPRAFALLIDIAIVSLIALLACFTGLFVLYGFDFGMYGSENLFMPVYMTLFLLSSTYFVFFHGYGGMTVGKMVLGIKLINRYGEGIGIWDAFLRWIGYFISGAFLFAGFLWSLVDSESQTWHDKIAGTYVVKD